MMYHMVNEQLRKRRASTFQTGADSFEKYRPSYPDVVLEHIVPEGTKEMVDIGAGTGKLTRKIAPLVDTVYAVDPSEDMLEQLNQFVPRAVTIHGTAEYLPMEDNCVDAAVCANSWHWLDREAASAEVARVVRPGGTFSIVWNYEEKSGGSREVFEKILANQFAYRGSIRSNVPGPTIFTLQERRLFPWEWELTCDNLVNLYMTHSAMRVLSQRQQDLKEEQLWAAINSHPDMQCNKLTLSMVTECWIYKLL